MLQAGFALKVGISHDDYDKSLVSPNGATASSPGLPRRLPWVKRACPQSQRGCVRFVHFFLRNDATALRLEKLFLLVPRVSEAATLG